MAFWNRRKKRQQEEELELEAEEKLEKLRREKQLEQEQKAATAEKERKENPAKREEYQTEIVKPAHPGDQKRYVTECCQAVQEADRQIAQIRREYQGVTDSLLDIQKIDRASGEDKKQIRDAARNIIKLTQERNQYKNRNLTISDVVMRRFEPYENELVDEIKKMYATESYQKAIEGDIDKLHEEKKKLRKEQQEIIEKQNALKGMAKVLIVLILSLFVLFVVIYYALEVDMTLPYLGTVLLAAVSAGVLFVESNRNRKEMAMADRKMEKAISLLNRVKIKCVNNLNVLDYAKKKFGVSGAAEFEKLWNEYVRAREYEKKFRENTEQLNYYCDSLLDGLKRQKVMEREIWIGQALALIDEREMVEIRHKLNSQRQILREQIEYNEGIKEEFVHNIEEVIAQNPENKEELLKIVKSYSQEERLEEDL